jgi:hypothetical protein
VFIRYRGNVNTEQLPNNDKGIFTEPLPSNDKGIHRQQRDLISLLYLFKIGQKYKKKKMVGKILGIHLPQDRDQW